MTTTLLFVLANVVLAYTGFCRLVRISLSTRISIRVSIYLLTVAAAVALGAVLAWGYRPDWPSAALAAAMALVQVATASIWRQGVPHQYQRS